MIVSRPTRPKWTGSRLPSKLRLGPCNTSNVAIGVPWESARGFLCGVSPTRSAPRAVAHLGRANILHGENRVVHNESSRRVFDADRGHCLLLCPNPLIEET